MSDLRRFPVSDEFNSYRKTLDSVCDRMIFFEFFSSHFSRKWKLLGESMKMSGMALRIEWKCSRVLAGPPSGRNPLVKCGLDTSAPFFRVSGNLKNGRCQKNEPRRLFPPVRASHRGSAWGRSLTLRASRVRGTLKGNSCIVT